MRRIPIILMIVASAMPAIATEPPLPKTAVTQTMPRETTGALDLDECFLMAVRHSETLQMKEETITQAAAKYKQALGNALPQITLKASELIQDVPTADQIANAGSISNTFLRRDTPYTQVNLAQPIFSGFKEYHALGAGKAMKSRTTHEKARAAQLLYQDVAQSFYTVIQIQNDVTILQHQRATLASRVSELQARAAIGRSRKSEVAAAEAQLANTEALLAEVKGTVGVAWEMLEFLTGMPQGKNLRDPFGAAHGNTLEHFLSRSDVREDVLAASDAVLEAKNNVGIAKSAHYPAIALSANYYPYRVGFYNDIKWDTTFTLTMPIFTSGIISGQVKEAQSKLRASTLNEQYTRRQSEKDIKAAYDTWHSGVEQANAYARAAGKNRINYDLQHGDYQNNLVNNLEVTQALTNLLDSERKANQLKFQSRLYYVQLLVASGMIPTLGNE